MCRNKLTAFQNNNTIKTEQMFGNLLVSRGTQEMTNNEMELIKIIRENDNPTRALITATLVVLGYLKQHESFEEQVAVCLQELS